MMLWRHLPPLSHSLVGLRDWNSTLTPWSPRSAQGVYQGQQPWKGCAGDDRSLSPSVVSFFSLTYVFWYPGISPCAKMGDWQKLSCEKKKKKISLDQQWMALLCSILSLYLVEPHQHIPLQNHINPLYLCSICLFYFHYRQFNRQIRLNVQQKYSFIPIMAMMPVPAMYFDLHVRRLSSSVYLFI